MTTAQRSGLLKVLLQREWKQRLKAKVFKRIYCKRVSERSTMLLGLACEHVAGKATSVDEGWGWRWATQSVSIDGLTGLLRQCKVEAGERWSRCSRPCWDGKDGCDEFLQLSDDWKEEGMLVKLSERVDFNEVDRKKK
jgi:hypothetical protein